MRSIDGGAEVVAAHKTKRTIDSRSRCQEDTGLKGRTHVRMHLLFEPTYTKPKFGHRISRPNYFGLKGWAGL
jgi:hypothetical protein